MNRGIRMFSPEELEAIYATAVAQLLKLTRDDKTFLRSILICPE